MPGPAGHPSGHHLTAKALRCNHGFIYNAGEEVNMVGTHTSEPDPGAPQPERPGGGHGLVDAPWWRLLLWAVVLIAVLVLVEKLGIL